MIKAIQGISLLDFPGKISAVVFIGGCNFRCPFCHNSDLVIPEKVRSVPNISIEKAIEEISKRRKLIDGVTITGGEPLLFPELRGLVKRVKELGLEVKVDTNGAFPSRLESLLNLVDYIAMDIKTSPDKYSLATGGRCNFKRIRESMEMLLWNDTDYEFRTTLVPGIVDESDIRKIATMIKGAKRYALQMYRPGDTLQPAFMPNSYSKERMENMRKIAEGFIEKVDLRLN